jgi:hypothetical protein
MSQPSAYQKVTSTFDVTEAGQPDNWKLFFDGVDDFMSTPSIDFTGTDKMSVFAGVRNNGASGDVFALNWNGNGEFRLSPRVNGYRATSTGDTRQTTPDILVNVPDNAVLFAEATISGPFVRLRRNSGTFSQNTASQGPGNYANAPVFIGSVNGSLALFNGHIYSLIVRGALTDTATIERTEKYVAGRTAEVTFTAPTIDGVPTIGVS